MVKFSYIIIGIAISLIIILILFIGQFYGAHHNPGREVWHGVMGSIWEEDGCYILKDNITREIIGKKDCRYVR